jgi:allantoate deiminase
MVLHDLPRELSVAAAARVLARCDELGSLSEEPGRLTRRFGTAALDAAMARVAAWMAEAGLRPWRDGVGNLVGRLEGTGPGTLVLGSHLDTVPDAGRYDGPLGVLVALEAVAAVRPRRAVEVVAFADEEGARFGTTYLGSAGYLGRLDPAALALTDEDGVALGDLVGELPSPRADLAGYLEVHIEQGPVLEREDAPVGVVTAITGQTRAALTLEGRAGHAGTVPMAARRDALCGAAEVVLAAEAAGRAVPGLVATVGSLAVAPGAGNVIPGEARVSLDLRHAEDRVRERERDALRAKAEAIAAARGLAASWEVRQEAGAVGTDRGLRAVLADAVRAAGVRVVELPSGAGHDAAQVALAAPVAMLFVRCAGGVSHHPDEAVAADDVAVAVTVLARALARLAV